MGAKHSASAVSRAVRPVPRATALAAIRATLIAARSASPRGHGGRPWVTRRTSGGRRARSWFGSRSRDDRRLRPRRDSSATGRPPDYFDACSFSAISWWRRLIAFSGHTMTLGVVPADEVDAVDVDAVELGFELENRVALAHDLTNVPESVAESPHRGGQIQGRQLITRASSLLITICRPSRPARRVP
jgi:hypothetical protein